MTTHYVEDYEDVTGEKVPADDAETKVVAAPAKRKPSPKSTAEVK